MHRFFIPTLSVKDKRAVILDYRIIHQLFKVLRMNVSDRFHIFNDKQEEFLVEIFEINKRKLNIDIIKSIKNNSESLIKLSLYQAIPKKPALLEMVIQKAVELGVTDIYPLITERTENRKIAKMDRLNMIAIEAAEQCGRIKIPVIHEPVLLKNIIPDLNNAYLAYVSEENNYLSDYKDLKKGDSAQIIIGPEGGFVSSEIDLVKKAGTKIFTLGPRILRTETAAIVALGVYGSVVKK